MSERQVDRPIGVTVISVLYALAAVVLIIVGIVAIGFGDALIDQIVQDEPDMDILYGINIIIGAVVIVIGLVSALVSYGLYNGWSIMWYLGSILAVIGAVINLICIAIGSIGNVISLLICAVIIYYLLKPNVKMFFLDKV